MKILFASVEVSPFAKVGGLADVASSLPKALRVRKHDARIVMPAYGMILADPRWKRERVLTDLQVCMNGHWEELAFVDKMEFDGVPIYLIGSDRWFGEATRSDLVYQPGVDKYLFFSEAVLAMAEALKWMPDVVHCNDWHTGFIPVLMREKYDRVWSRTAGVYTIHNFAYQGEFGMEVLDKLGLPHSLFNARDVEAWGAVNFLKSGCVYADRVNTVSKRYAEEIQTPAYGCKLEGLMRHLKAEGKLSGILNGIDTDVFNPATDPLLPAHFSATQPGGKKECRAALLKQLGLPNDPAVPILGVVSRLSEQKGLDLLVAAAERLIALPAMVVVQGLGDPWLVEKLETLQKQFPDRLRFIQAFDEKMAQLVYSGSDLFAMPSRFEPCGLGQLIALRYGTVPVVRHTGGLADTIFEGQNGFVFEDATADDFLFAVARAAQAFAKPDVWAKYVATALSADFSWTSSALKYEDLYAAALEARLVDAVPAVSA